MEKALPRVEKGEPVRVLLFQQKLPVKSIPVGLAYLAAALQQQGEQVTIVNAAAPYRPLSRADLKRELARLKPHIFGITLSTPFVRLGYDVLSSLGRIPALVVAGGPHPTLRPEEVLRFGADVAVIGEGEATICQLAQFVRGELALNDIAGLCFRDTSGSFRRTEPRPLVSDLDSLPFPARHLFSVGDYVRSAQESIRFGPIVSSRGCPFGCAYCSNAVFGTRYRFRSARNVFAEIKDTFRRYGVRRFTFVDDVFTLRRERVEELCRLIIEDKELDITWTCLAVIKSVTPDLLKLMRAAGCIEIAYGIESANKETLRKIHKPVDPERAREVLAWTKEAGIDAHACFIIGYPWEGEREVRNTLRYMREVAPLVATFPNSNILVPFPGTELYRNYHRQYGFTAWWLSRNGFNSHYRSDTQPAFYQRIYYDDRGQLPGKRTFFPHTRKTWKAIWDTVKFVGNRYLEVYPPRLTTSPWGQKIFKKALSCLVWLSYGTYRVHPRLERALFGKILALGRRLPGISRG